MDNLCVGTRDDLAQVCEFEEFDKTAQPASFDPFRVQFIQGDILDEPLAAELGKGADVIVHLAANTGDGPSVENPRLDCVTNVIGTLNYLESARHNGVKRFVFAQAVRPWGSASRLFTKRRFPFIYIYDLVRAIGLAASRPAVGGEVFQIATNAETTVGEILEMLKGEFARRGMVHIEYRHGDKRTGDVMRNYFDTSKARRMLGWEMQVRLSEGIGRAIEYFLVQKKLS